MRTFKADPQKQVENKPGDVKLPEWVPEHPHWMKDVCSSVDQSVQRQWRLCGPDCVYPVPQDVFERGCLYPIPPVHLFYKKNVKALEIIFKSWAGLEMFWIKRVTEEDLFSLPGLSAPTWRDVLDGKYKYLGEQFLPRPPEGYVPPTPVAPTDAAAQVCRRINILHTCPNNET